MTDPTPAPPADDIPEALPEGDAFDRAYVEKLRDQAAKYRLESSTYRKAFSGYAPEEREALLEMIETLDKDPERGATQFRDVSYQLLGDEKFHAGAPWAQAIKQEVEAHVEEVKDQETGTVSADEVARIVQEALEADREQRKQEEAISGVRAEVIAAGFEPGSEGYARTLYEAAHFTDGDVAAAAERVRRFLSAAEADAPASEETTAAAEAAADAVSAPAPAPAPAKSWPVTATAGGAGASTAPVDETPKSFSDARARMRARLRQTAQPGQ
jgi:hypothetical protein